MNEPTTSDRNESSDSRPASFPKGRRLLKGVEFDAVFANRTASGDGVLLVHGRPNGLGYPRLGLVVSRKVGKAVRRNRWKRLLREAFRLAQHDLPPFDLVCLPKSREEPTLAAVSASLLRLAQRVERGKRRRGAP